MIAAIIGISSAFIIILLFIILKQFDKKIIYGLILAGIGFLYVGFAWMDLQAFIINSLQAILFVFIAYFGIKKNVNILAAGYFLHGSWDLIYHLFSDPALIPPHYNLFCSTLDYVICIYLLVIRKQLSGSRMIPINTGMPG